MKPFERYLYNLSGFREFLNTYLEMRRHFQELDFSEEDLERPPKYTQEMMLFHFKISNLQQGLLKQVNDFGFDVDDLEFYDFILPLMQKINKLTPLKDGNTERRDSGNEDN
jgi:hypothetical protein